ncbi:hypothetical protein BDN72DRAFT_897535 [Pluteus cervinus]|uniref:Uncharacterized protein n=1 Tax=Pluteus cervinus TaxID=181527 RepID=A0ACD3AU69_9AGAR|nr:hypothetical protein BDN72DRAFT_897535 [Pluteus cervinus]
MDTRRFTTPRHRCDYDYDGPRVFRLGLGFILRLCCGTNFHCHDVVDPHDGDKRYELWSPNAELALFPGVRPENFSLDLPLLNPRFDGSGGRWDFTLNPQYLEYGKLHHAFIRRTTSYSLSTDPPEFWPLTNHWESRATSSENIGIVSYQFYQDLTNRAKALLRQVDAICRGRRQDFERCSYWLPKPPNLVPASWCSEFLKPNPWEYHVDRIAHFQRQLKELAAWAECATRLIETNFSINNSRDVLYQQDFPRADERYLGVWAPGEDETAIVWLLGRGIPCYFVHQYRENFEYGEHIAVDRRNTVIKGFIPQVTPIHLSPEHNPYFKLALHQQAPISRSHPSMIPYTFPQIHITLENENRSGSWVHRFRFSGIKDPRTGTIAWPLTHAGSLTWIKPPPIPAGDRNLKKWTIYCLEEIGGQPCMQERSKSNSKVPPWYDRENRRILYFRDELPPVRGLRHCFGVDEYGRPAPFYNYVGKSTGRHDWVPVAQTRTQWIYRKQFSSGTPLPEQKAPRPKDPIPTALLSPLPPLASSPQTPISDQSDLSKRLETSSIVVSLPDVAQSNSASRGEPMDVDGVGMRSTQSPCPPVNAEEVSNEKHSTTISNFTAVSNTSVSQLSAHSISTLGKDVGAKNALSVGVAHPISVSITSVAGPSQALASRNTKSSTNLRFSPYPSSSKQAETPIPTNTVEFSKLPPILADAIASATGSQKAALQRIFLSFTGGRHSRNAYLSLDVAPINGVNPPLLTNVLAFGTFVISNKTGFYLRYWHIIYPDLPFTTLIGMAVQRGLHVRLTVKTSDIRGMITSLLRPPAPAPEMFPSGISPTGLAKWSQKRGVQSSRRACSIYTEGVRSILRLPRARRLILEGGLLWRIALQWDGMSLYQIGLNGPSPLALHYRVGETHPDLELFDDALPDPVMNILLGVQDNGSSFWPSPALLEYGAKWYGLWNNDLENWFQHQASKISSGEARTYSKSEWRKFFKTFRVVDRNNAEVIGSEAHAQQLCGRLDADFPDLWLGWTGPYDLVLRDPVACPFDGQDLA